MQVTITTHTLPTGIVLEADVTDLPVSFDEQTPDGRQVRYFDFGADAPPDAADVVKAQLRAELPVPANAPAKTSTVDL